jgi:hypothetical protein
VIRLWGDEFGVDFLWDFNWVKANFDWVEADFD